jgi:hypothetical protein
MQVVSEALTVDFEQYSVAWICTGAIQRQCSASAFIAHYYTL